MQRQFFIGPIQALRLGNNTVNKTTSERLLGVHVNNKMTWLDQVANVAKSFASKLSLLQRMKFLRKQSGDFHTKVILPSVTYGLVVWGSCNKTLFGNLEKLHARAENKTFQVPTQYSFQVPTQYFQCY